MVKIRLFRHNLVIFLNNTVLEVHAHRLFHVEDKKGKKGREEEEEIGEEWKKEMRDVAGNFTY